MASVQAVDFKTGLTIEVGGDVCSIVEFLHVNPGKGAAYVRVKMRNITKGGVVEKTYRPNEKFETAHIDRNEAQFTYFDDMYHFMDTTTYDEIVLSPEDVGDAMKFVKEEMTVKLISYKGKVFSIEPPTTVELKITHSEPGVKGNTATGATKPATLETGVEIQVPLFVDEGEVIKVDTRTGEYLSRA